MFVDCDWVTHPCSEKTKPIQFSPLTDWIVVGGVGWGAWRMNQQSSSSSLFCRRPLVSSSGMGRDVHSLMLFQHFLCQPRRRLPSMVSWRMVLERLSWHVTCASHTSCNFWPFMLISALMLFVLLIMIFLFSVVTSIPYAVALSTSLLVRSWS